MYNILGVDQKPLVFLFTEAQIAQEGFLEYINNVLTIGMIPALFNDDEKDQITGNVRAAAREAGYGITKDEVWKYFTNTCIDNLHVVLSMSPSGDKLRNRCRSFPGLVNNTTIDWIFPWPDQALIAVASVYLKDKPKITDEFRDPIISHIVHVHQAVNSYTAEYHLRLRRKNYLTPKHYLDFISNYLKLLDEKDAYIVTQCERLEGGLIKIAEASVQLEELNSKLEVQKVVVQKATEECEAMLIEIKQGTADAKEKKEIASTKSVEVEEKKVIISKEQGEAEAILAEAMPALLAARQALEALDKSDITEIRYETNFWANPF